MKGIGKKIRFIRNLKLRTQWQMADRLNITQSAYSKIEASNEHIDIYMLEKVAIVLDVSLMQLLNFNEKSVLSEKKE